MIAQRERTIALRPTDGGLVAHTFNEQRDLNAAEPLFERVRDVKLAPEMIALATQIVERQSENYDPADRYESRLRAMLDAKVKGEGLRPEAEPAVTESDVIDLAALTKSLGQAPSPAEAKPVAKAAPAKRAAKPDETRRQPALKLPLQGGKKPAREAAPAAESQAPTGRRKAS